MKEYTRSRGVAPLMLNRGAGWRSVVSRTFWLYSWERVRCTFSRKLDVPREPVGTFGSEVNILYRRGYRGPYHPARSLVTVLFMLSRLMILM